MIRVLVDYIIAYSTCFICTSLRETLIYLKEIYKHQMFCMVNNRIIDE